MYSTQQRTYRQTKIKQILCLSLVFVLCVLLYPTATLSTLVPYIQFQDQWSQMTMEEGKKDEYEIILRSESQTAHTVDRLEEISLIFADGFLIDHTHQERENVQTIQQKHAFNGEGAARYDVITLHYATLHEADGQNGHQFSMSDDQVYIFSTAFSSPTLFREARTNTQKQWQRIMDRSVDRSWTKRWDAVIHSLDIQREDYEWIPLHELPQYESLPLPSFDEDETRQVLLQIWNKIITTYVQGNIHNKQHAVTPEGSIMPLIGVHNEGEDYYILYKTEGGTAINVKESIDINNKS